MAIVKIFKIATAPIALKILLKGQMTYLSDKGYEVYTISSAGPEIQDLYKTEKIKEHFCVDLKRKITPFIDLIAIFQCYKLIKLHRPDIVHTYTPKAGLIGMIASYLAGTKIRIHNVTGLVLIEKKGIFKYLLIIIEKFVYCLATQVYVNSFGLQTYIKENISKKVKVLGYGSTNGIDIDFFRENDKLVRSVTLLRKKLKLDRKDFVWIYIGRIVKDKGIIELIEAFEKTSKEFKSKLILVGNYEHELDPIPLKTLEKIKSNENIIEVGFQDDVRPFLSMSDCLVLPTYREGLPNVLLQASCLNKPIIATNINGCNEIVNHFENGILVEPKNIVQLKSAMVEIFHNKKLRKKIIESTRKNIIEKYDQRKVWNDILSEYNSLLKNV